MLHDDQTHLSNIAHLDEVTIVISLVAFHYTRQVEEVDWQSFRAKAELSSPAFTMQSCTIKVTMKDYAVGRYTSIALCSQLRGSHTTSRSRTIKSDIKLGFAVLRVELFPNSGSHGLVVDSQYVLLLSICHGSPQKSKFGAGRRPRQVSVPLSRYCRC